MKVRLAWLMLSLLMLWPGGAIPGAAESGTDAWHRLTGRVETLGLGRKGYILGRVLNREQKDWGREHSLPAAVPGTYKFEDSGLFVVADGGPTG